MVLIFVLLIIILITLHKALTYRRRYRLMLKRYADLERSFMKAYLLEYKNRGVDNE